MKEVLVTGKYKTTERFPVSTGSPQQNMATHENYMVALCKLGKLEMVRQAIAHGASVNSKRDGITCLMAAVAKSHVKIVSLLLEHPEIAVNAKDDSNQAGINFVVKPLAACLGARAMS